MTKGQHAPRTVTHGLRQRAWWVMRKRTRFSLTELLSTLADGTERDAKGNLGKYLRALERAGILRRDTERQPGAALTSNGHIVYVLVVNDGRSAPVWRASVNEVYDPNSGKVYPIQETCVPAPVGGEDA